MGLIIETVTPARGRSGDIVRIDGGGFSSDPSEMACSFGGISAPGGPISGTLTEFTVSFEVPAGIEEDTFIELSVQRRDSFDGDTVSWWSKAASEGISSSSVPGQIPGPLEAPYPNLVAPDVPLASDYERIATKLEWILRELAPSPGSIVVGTGSGVSPLAPGGGGEVLTPDSGSPTGLGWTQPASSLTLQWGKEWDSAPTNNGAAVANGDSTELSATQGQHGIPFSGSAVAVVVLVQEALGAGTATLDQVQVAVNGVVVHDSLTGLALAAGGVYPATFSLPVVQGQNIELRLFKTAGGGGMRATGSVKIDQADSAKASNSVSVSDVVVAQLVGFFSVAESEEVGVEDIAQATLE